MKKILITALILAMIIISNCRKLPGPSSPAATMTPNMTSTAQVLDTQTVIYLQTAGPSAQATATAQSRATQTAGYLQTQGPTAQATATAQEHATQTAVYLQTAGTSATPTATSTVTPTATATVTSTASATVTPTATPTPKVIDNFSSASSTNNMGGYWFTIDDCAYGGDSIISPMAASEGGTFFKTAGGANGEAYAAHITGTVTGYNTTTKAGYEYGFAGLGTLLSAFAGATTLTTGCSQTDISMYTGLSFYAKAGPYDSGNPYEVVIAYTMNGAGAVICPTPGVISNNGRGIENPPSCTDDSPGACQCASLDSNGDYYYALPALTQTWVLVTAPFAQWTVPSWAALTNPVPPPTIRPVLKNAKQIVWQPLNYPNPTQGTPPGSFNIELYIGDVELY